MGDPIYHEALERFSTLLEQAKSSNLREPTAMTLATADASGRPTARIVLMRGFDERGFVFYTNSLSTKGRQLAENAQAALCFYWDEMERQVRIEGEVVPVGDEESNAYWRRRPRGSRVGAWASLQSQPLDDRETLERRTAEFEEKFEDDEVPRPEHWCGYRVKPRRIEFWEARPSRLHVRTVFHRADAGWTKGLVYP